MKKLLFIASVLAILLTSGCGVASLGSIGRACEPFYESKLIGKWMLYRETDKPSDATITVTRAGQNIYKVSLIDNKNCAAQYSAMLVKAGSLSIIETVPAGRLQLDGKELSTLHQAQTIPLYSYFIIDNITEDKIELRGLNPDKVKSYIADTDAEYVIKKESPQYVLLTGDEKNVRDFIVEAASDKDLWIPLTLIEPESHAACYDPRAVAIAFSRSEYFEAYLNKKMRESSEAEESGNINLVEKIKNEVQQMQESLHRIAFYGEAADVIFDLVKAKVEDVKKCESANELVSKWDNSANVDELPDVTESLISIFSPSLQALKVIEDLPEKPIMAESAKKE